MRHLRRVSVLAPVILVLGCPSGPELEAPVRERYLEYQVDVPILPIPGYGFLRYPDQLRAAGTEGSVLIEFVVDTAGRYMAGTSKVLRSDHRLFSEAALQAIPEMRFVPATLDGRKVAQLVQQPFTFSIGSYR